MSNTPEPHQRFGRRALIAGATIVGVTIGAAGLAGAAQSAMHLNEPEVRAYIQSVIESNDLTDDNGTDTSTEISTEDTTDDSGVDTSDDVNDDNGTDDSTDTTIDDNGDDNGDDDNNNSTSTSVEGQVALPDPFTETYTSAGGTVTVTWDGSAFTLDDYQAADGYTAEVKDQRADRIRVDFKGPGNHRTEVRISDDTNTVRVRID